MTLYFFIDGIYSNLFNQNCSWINGSGYWIPFFQQVMLKPYLTPFFWALTFCIVLYKPRQAVINFLKPLSKFEIDPQNDSYKLRVIAKASFFIERIAHPLKNFNMVFFVFLVLGYIFCGKLILFYFQNWLNTDLIF